MLPARGRNVYGQFDRVRIGSCGVVDVLTHDLHSDISFMQQDDLTMFGALIFMLCCSNLGAMNNLQKAIDHLGRHYSADLKSVALFLISKGGPHKACFPVSYRQSPDCYSRASVWAIKLIMETVRTLVNYST